MARGRLSKKLSDSDAMTMFAEHHIVQVRRGKNGEIHKVKHVAWGWIDPKAYYAMQEAHKLLPIVEKLIEGGYRLKQAMWNVSIQILATDVELPIGEGLMLAMAGKLFLSLKDGNEIEALKWAAMLALPFGDIAAIWILSQETLNLFGGSAQTVTDIGEWIARLIQLGPILGGLPPLSSQIRSPKLRTHATP